MFSLKSLFLLVLVAAVFVVAFLNSSPIWASVIVTLTVLLLIAASVSIYLFPEKRPILVCAVIAGSIYGSLALSASSGCLNHYSQAASYFDCSVRVLKSSWGTSLL